MATGTDSIESCRLTSMEIPIIKIRPSWGRLIFIMRIPIHGKTKFVLRLWLLCNTFHNYAHNLYFVTFWYDLLMVHLTQILQGYLTGIGVVKPSNSEAALNKSS